MTSPTDPYVDIRPYGDDEIPAALNRLINDEEFISAILHYRFSNHASWFKALMSPILRVYLKMKWSKLTSVESIQIEVKKYLRDTLAKTTNGVTYTGVESLDVNQAYLFVSNHRDIAMDPALVNYALHQNNHQTCRIAIGDNLLKKPCATELMRLNKSFIVKRSLKGPREMMKALGQLSSYIKHSLETGNSIWIAQKEGRAKDGNDFTEPAILKMFHVEGRKQKIAFPEYVKSLKIVPVAISYENDPCDTAKAIELFEKDVNGSYEKGEFEDIESIIQGIIGNKGRVHVGFGQVIDQDFDTPEALAEEIDRQIHENYKLFPVNLLAADKEDESITAAVKQEFEEKLSSLPKGARQYLIDSYANPVKNIG
ncbi:1-acyl-sn-glycerol-3-phosphate acyltransferase [Vibrio sp. Isolate34]|uniref:1-acyl-sn-glycerol-3-phosphate acyltransferase n=1 Tax=Vibrio sp. Isolate34 TaxID=2908540 RepID=UPI001EFD1915|nr:1-acyl-sn-glycerol-3-phosphate acyltransferase [Vibrio sp. Isolate34]MCG9641292.1 1-acyl-sn-glycerol-3-phosphate acyltransferase [Vibrio sp. Isolate34]